jgi:hypothetical protein
MGQELSNAPRLGLNQDCCLPNYLIAEKVILKA